MQFSNGAIYQGQWLQGKKHGQGVESYPDGSEYTGKFANNEREGFGKVIYADQASVEG